MPAGFAMTLFPKISPKLKQIDYIGFRPTERTSEYVNAAVVRGYKKTAVVQGLMDLAMDTEAAMGPVAWGRLEAYAKHKGLTLGAAIGELAKESLDRR